ncbi:hypothetical protein B0A54_11296 [Friedmanniomyces endolithicus]|uniref:Uncharacterized protein n=1 Tax=Friedmanniomyces endolithicus TaxID=329885 RepID=A0A4U0UN94_9PEZI|nr:hypothetical protein B0A54_11296 [Friedmanniomyces endolithicus]
MCHSRSITYTCHHTLTFRLSTCRGTFAHPAHPNRTWSTAQRAACHDSPALALQSPQPCGECQRAAIGAEYAELRADLQRTMLLQSPSTWTDSPSAEYREAEAELVEQCYRLVHSFPARWGKSARLRHGARRTPGVRSVGCSPLRREVLREEVPEGFGCPIWGWDGDWGCGHKTMAEEVEEREAEEAEEGRAYEALCATETLAWGEEVSTPDHACDVEGTEDVAEEEAVLEPSGTITDAAEMTTMNPAVELEAENAQHVKPLGVLSSSKEPLAKTGSSPRLDFTCNIEGAERELGEAAREPASRITVAAEMTTIITEAEQVALSAENANPSLLRAPEPPRRSVATRSKSRSKCDYDAHESRWGCLPSWLMVSS